jgi:hypothetical protein
MTVASNPIPAAKAGLLFPLELMLPLGQARSARVLGSAMPAWHSSFAAGAEEGFGADLILAAPTGAECRDADWLDRALRQLEDAAHRGGVGYVLAPRRWRRHVLKRLRMMDSVRVEHFVHLPDVMAPAFIVPLTEYPLRYAFSQAASLPVWVRQTAGLLSGTRLTRRLLGRALPSAAFAVRAPETALFEWLTRHAPQESGSWSTVMRPSWRGNTAPAMLHCFPASEPVPVVVAKVAGDPTSGDAIRAEVANLEALRRDAEASGARVPDVIACVEVGGLPAIVQTSLSGTPATVFLASRPDRVAVMMERVSEWLLHWHRKTSIEGRLEQHHLARWIDAPLDRLAVELPGAAIYAERVRAAIEGVGDAPIPLVAAHHDLTMSNVLLDGTAGIGVVDWEAAEQHALPLGDWFYTAVDIVRAAGTESRLDAFRACFDRDGRYAGTMRALTGRFVTALGLSAPLVQLSFDACWLRHAQNEARGALPGQPRPFLAVLAQAGGGFHLYDRGEP